MELKLIKKFLCSIFVFIGVMVIASLGLLFVIQISPERSLLEVKDALWGIGDYMLIGCFYLSSSLIATQSAIQTFRRSYCG